MARPNFSGFPTPARTLALIAARRDPERQFLGTLAAAIQYDDAGLVDQVIAAALSWPETTGQLKERKATLLFALTGLLARGNFAMRALQLAPTIPLAQGMKQILVFTVAELRQTFCWRVTPAYALVTGRMARPLPVEPLVEPFQQGQVDINMPYVRHVLVPKGIQHPPIVLLPHAHGLVHLDGGQYVILDGNHRVVSAYERRRRAIPSYILTEQEAAAVLISHSRFPPYEAPGIAS